ncbi:MAG TPA: hypothetical protein VKX28_18685 [Xanthobacteraceae bacterium]|jgi:hypothetical protein|nr:hypothetical protein [Xanthobacteraceae bacterium]
MRAVHIIPAAALLLAACLPASAEVRLLNDCTAQFRACNAAIAGAPNGPAAIAIAGQCYRQLQACRRPGYMLHERIVLPGPMIPPRRDFSPVPRMSGPSLATMRHVR